MAYDEKEHGMFTYYLLKKLQDSKGNVTYKELGDYICDQVQLQSVIINNKKQMPQINLGGGIDEGWGNWQFVK
ncbi:MAG: hypothetical protein RQ761_12050 [Bacteroidales bacterium]|nr:hypothetical protein [Bacteroidales bacterium]